MDSLQVLILPGCLKLDNLTRDLSTLESLEKLYANGTAITGYPSFISSLTNLQELEIGRCQQTESPTWWKLIFQKQPQSLVLPFLASLPLLTGLRVRNCNISGVCHGTLSCLKHLHLIRPKVTNIYANISLANYVYLILDNSFHKFPMLTGSMSELPPPSLIRRHHNLHCYFTGCPCVYKPTSHASTSQLSILIEYLGIQSKIREFFGRNGTWRYRELEIIVKGNRIPRWFTNKSKGSHVKVDLPPNWRSKFNRYAFCVLFMLKGSCIGPPGVYVSNFDGTPLFGLRATLSETILIYDTDIMIWLYVRTRDVRWTEAKNFVSFSLGDNNEDVEVKGCGERLVYDDDEDIENEDGRVLSMIQHLPPQTQPTGGHFWFFNELDVTSFSW